MASMAQATTSATSDTKPHPLLIGQVEAMESGRYKNGVTLVEILVVVALITLLATMVVGIATRIDNQSKEKAVEGTFALLESALQEYYDFTGFFPEQPEKDFTKAAAHSEFLYAELNAIPGSRTVLEKISDKLIQNKAGIDTPEIYDLWGKVIDYRYVDGDAFPKLRSAGPNRTFYDGDDITNR